MSSRTSGFGPGQQWIDQDVPEQAAGAPAGPPGPAGLASTVPGPTGPAGETRLKWAKVRLTTNASGVWSENLGAGLFAAEPGLAVIPKMASGSYDWTSTITGSAVAGYTATVMFTKRKNSIDISLGALLNVGLIEASPGVVTFDLEAFERTA